MSDDPKILAALATLNTKMDSVLDHLGRINGTVGEHDDNIHDLDIRTAMNSQKIETIEKQPSAIRAIILVGGILGVALMVATLIVRFG